MAASRPAGRGAGVVSEQPHHVRRWRLTPFSAGILSGLATCMVVGGLGFWLLTVLGRQSWYSVEVLANGGDITRLGGASLAIEYDHGGAALNIACRGACDDFGYRADTGDAGVRVRVLDARGACLVCDRYTYVDGASVVRLAVAGRDRLTATASYGAGAKD